MRFPSWTRGFDSRHRLEMSMDPTRFFVGSMLISWNAAGNREEAGSEVRATALPTDPVTGSPQPHVSSGLPGPQRPGVRARDVNVPGRASGWAGPAGRGDGD